MTIIHLEAAQQPRVDYEQVLSLSSPSTTAKDLRKSHNKHQVPDNTRVSLVVQQRLGRKSKQNGIKLMSKAYHHAQNNFK